MTQNQIDFSKLIEKLEDSITKIQNAIVDEASARIQSSFPESSVDIEHTPSGADIHVANADNDFLKKEFGADNYHPAHKTLRLKRDLSKKIRKEFK